MFRECSEKYKQEITTNLTETRRMERVKRQQIVLWKKPLLTLKYFLLELIELLKKEKRNAFKHRKTFFIIALFTVLIFVVYLVDGSHQVYSNIFKKDFLWCSYWVVLGILSSVGLGTGLHTFLLYLGPHIAKVTLAAWECNSLDFPEPPYPDKILCPIDKKPTTVVNLLTIMSKVRLEAVMWGVGTSIGELPPYFMARAARLSGGTTDDPNNEELEELEELMKSEKTDCFTKVKKAVPKIVERVGFVGILLFASIPNPLFDLAGITCGHCLVPFWTFFGATLIGKAIIKMHLQQTFVILCFSKAYVEHILSFLGRIPTIGQYLKSPFQKAVLAQKAKLHKTDAPDTTAVDGGTNVLSFLFENIVTIMVAYFIISIINSMAQSYAKRLRNEKLEK